MAEHKKDDLAEAVDAFRTLAGTLAKNPTLSGKWYFPEEGCGIIYVKGKNAEEVQQKLTEQANKPF